MEEHLDAAEVGPGGQLKGELLRVDTELTRPPATRVWSLSIQLLGTSKVKGQLRV